MATKTTKGQRQRKRTKNGKIRKDNFKRLYQRPLKDLHLDNQELKITAIVWPGRKADRLSLDGVVEQLDWEDASAELTGTLALRKPDAAAIKGEVLKVNRTVLGHGTVIKTDLSWGGKFSELWRMRVWDPESTLDESSLSFPLFDDIKFLRESRDDFVYRRGKKRHKKGWRCDQILRDVAKRYKIPLGKIAKGKHYIKKLEMKNVSPIDVIIKAYRLERQATARRFVIAWRRGGMNVFPLERGDIQYHVGPHIQGGTVTQKRAKGFCTALTARTTVGKGKTKKKISVKVKSKTGVKRYGYIHKQIDIGEADSETELKQLAKRALAERLVLKNRIAFTHTGLATLRRGDIIDVDSLKDFGFTGRRDKKTGLHDDIFWISRVSHSYTPGAFTSETETTQRDPFKAQEERQRKHDAAVREKKRKKRKKK